MKGTIGIARILSTVVHFFLKKFTIFLVLLDVQPKTANLTTPPPSPQLSPPSNNLLKNLTSCSAWGALTPYHYKLRQKFLYPPWGARAPSATPWLRL